MTKRILLIDADMVAFRVAAAEEKEVSFDGETYILTADADNGRSNLKLMLDNWQRDLEADHLLLAFTDSQNYRKGVLPTYKGNREGVRRPLILKAMQQYCWDNWECKIVPTLEADDVLGIMASNPKMLAEYDEKIVVTWDKDLRTIPGLHWNPTNGWAGEGDARHPVIDTVTLKEADNAFYAQCLSGDAVDGYAGCPGVGVKRAAQIVDSRTLVYPSTDVIQRGPNKGTERTVWKQTTDPNPWHCVVAQYEKAGLTAEDALQTARVARILRGDEYDFKKKEPILWQPPA